MFYFSSSFLKQSRKVPKMTKYYNKSENNNAKPVQGDYINEKYVSNVMFNKHL